MLVRFFAINGCLPIITQKYANYTPSMQNENTNQWIRNLMTSNIGSSYELKKYIIYCQKLEDRGKRADAVYTIYKFISDKWNLISDSCNCISDSCNWISNYCNWISDSCNWISDSCNWISVLCNIISDKWNLISANEIEIQNNYLPILFQRQNWMCLFWTYFRTLLVVSAIYTRKFIYFFANEIKLSFAIITGFN